MDCDGDSLMKGEEEEEKGVTLETMGPEEEETGDDGDETSSLLGGGGQVLFALDWVAVARELEALAKEKKRPLFLLAQSEPAAEAMRGRLSAFGVTQLTVTRRLPRSAGSSRARLVVGVLKAHAWTRVVLQRELERAFKAAGESNVYVQADPRALEAGHPLRREGTPSALSAMPAHGWGNDVDPFTHVVARNEISLEFARGDRGGDRRRVRRARGFERFHAWWTRRALLVGSAVPYTRRKDGLPSLDAGRGGRKARGTLFVDRPLHSDGGVKFPPDSVDTLCLVFSRHKLTVHSVAQLLLCVDFTTLWLPKDEDWGKGRKKMAAAKYSR